MQDVAHCLWTVLLHWKIDIYLYIYIQFVYFMHVILQFVFLLAIYMPTFLFNLCK